MENKVLPQESTTVERIRKEVSKSGIAISRIYQADYQKEGSMTAELKQTIKTTSFYPSKSVSNDMQDNIFGTKEFGYAEQSYENEEVRVAWINVPKNATEASVMEQLNKFPEATLYKVLSNKPILTSDQKYAVKEGITSLEAIASKQVVRYGDGHENAGSLVLDPNGKVQYRQVYFKANAIEDQDLRTAEPSDFYATEEITAELNNSGQKVIN